MKFKTYKGGDLKGLYAVTRKLDGVRVHMDRKNGATSRAGKPLYNVPGDLPEGVYECYVGSWEATVSALRTKLGAPLLREFFFRLTGPRDSRLVIDHVSNPTHAEIQAYFEAVRKHGDEGLVLVNMDDGTYIKVKDKETHDVKITDVIAGTGKHLGRLGALVTARGNVGTGFTDQQRQDLWLWHTTGHNGEFDEELVGKVIEVECMSLTPGGKFRHPRFVRLREDKA